MDHSNIQTCQEIKLSDTTISNSNNNHFSLDSEADDGEKSEPNIDIYITLALFNKIMKRIKNIYDIYIKNKHTSIVKYKVITLTVQKLEKIHANL